MARYIVTLIRKSIKNGQAVHYGDTKDIIIKNVHTKSEAEKAAKKQASINWKVLNSKAANIADPDAR